MKRLLLTMCALLAGLTAANAITVRRGMRPDFANGKRVSTLSVNKKEVVKSEGMHDLSKITRADGFDVITEAPEGQLVKMMGNSETFYVDYGMVQQEEAFGIAYEAVFTDNGEIYLKDPIGLLKWGAYIKGEVTGTGLSFTFPQPFSYIDTEKGRKEIYYDLLEWGEIVNPFDPEDVDEGYIPSEERTLTFMKDEEGNYVMDGDYMLGVTCEGDWQGYGEKYMTLRPFEAEPVTAPAGLDYDYSYILADELNGWDYTIYRQIGLAFDGEDVYIDDLHPGFERAIVKGTFDKEANTLTIPTDQFLGEYYDHYIFMMTGRGYEEYDDYWEEYVIEFDIMDEPVVFNFDPEKRLFTPVIPEGYEYVYLIYNFGNQQVFPFDYYAVDRIYYQGAITDYAPIAPEVLGVESIDWIDPDYSYSFQFNIFGDNAEGQMLRDRSIYYNLYVNGKPFKLTVEDYPELAEEGYTELTDIPVALNAGSDIYASGSYHGIAFRKLDEEIRTIGVRAICIEGEHRGESPVVTVDTEGNLIPEGIAETVSTMPVRTEWYDLGGRRIAGPEQGAVSIRRVIYADGTVKTEKIR